VCRNTQRALTGAPGLRDHYPPNRWREVAPRGQSIPQFVEVARELCLEIRDRLSIYSSRSQEYFEIIDQLNQQYNITTSRNSLPIGIARGLTLKEAAAIAGISIGTFKKAQSEGKFPKPTLPGKRYDACLLHNAMNRLSGIGDQQALIPLDRWRASKSARLSERH
jgi:hypothetical protein